jgi:hypothetical protein
VTRTFGGDGSSSVPNMDVLEYSILVQYCCTRVQPALPDRPSQEGEKIRTEKDTLRGHSLSQTRNKYWIIELELMEIHATVRRFLWYVKSE